MHVATTKRRYKGKVYEAHLLRRSIRDGKKVRHETLGNLSHLPPHVIDLIRRALKGETFVSAEESFECLRSLPHGHVAAVLGTLRQLGLDKLIASRRSRMRDLVVALIVARIIDPRSKLAIARGLAEETALSTLAQTLDIVSAGEEELYAAMDWLVQRQGAIEGRMAKRHLAGGALVLYDVTSSYFEGRTCPLARRGYSRDGKKGTLQIVIGLLCACDGKPVAVEVFDGNTGDPSTVASQIEKIQERFGLSEVVLVGDRGMITSARIREDLAPVDGLRWITSLRAPAIRSLMDEGALQPSLFDEIDLAEITAADYPGERLIVCRNPLLATDRARKRQELLAATEREFQKIVAATKRKARRLSGTGKIAMSVGRVQNRYKVGKHFEVEITDNSFSYSRKIEQIKEEAALDGFYVIRTNVPAATLGAEDTVRAYKGLSVVERAFRSMKTMDLKIRPIHHRLAKRVRSHVFLCMLAYYVEWHMREALAPILFDDHERAAAEEARTSNVAPAQRSDAAKRKAASKSCDDGKPVHSFQTLLADLATIVSNRMRSRDAGEETFEVTTTPTPVQRRALDLLDVSLRV
ncbi:MAG: IS1634 family transposase [Gemmatimonadales bacterium]|nr:MAG: IS1634 family transposase [Gemmatimonadales bacterium]